MDRLLLRIASAARNEIDADAGRAGQEREENDQIRPRQGPAMMSESLSGASSILFIDEVATVLRVSRSTIERRRRDGTFPIAELPSLDSRPRWTRQAVERFLASSTGGPRRARRVSRR